LATEIDSKKKTNVFASREKGKKKGRLLRCCEKKKALLLVVKKEGKTSPNSAETDQRKPQKGSTRPKEKASYLPRALVQRLTGEKKRLQKTKRKL